MHWPQIAGAGFKAAFFGSLVGTSLPSLFTLVIGAMLLAESFGGALLVMLLPFLIGLAGACTGLAAVGLPMTFWLKSRRAESRRAYLIGGLIAGVAIPPLLMFALLRYFDSSILVLAAFGALTGGATGHFWWRFARQDEVENGEDEIAEVFG